MFTDRDGEDFRDHLHIYQKKRPAGPVSMVASHNLLRWWDGAHVTVLDSSRLRVTLNQWGTWWTISEIGATDFETPLYRVHFTDPGHEYELTLKQPADSVVALYLKDARWHAVDFSRVGEEQWTEGNGTRPNTTSKSFGTWMSYEISHPVGARCLGNADDSVNQENAAAPALQLRSAELVRRFQTEGFHPNPEQYIPVTRVHR
jgi:hypothetical protein